MSKSHFQSLTMQFFPQCCLADCYIEAALRTYNAQLSNGLKARIMLEAVDKEYIEEDGFVKDPVSLLKLAVPGTNWTVEKTALNKVKGEYAAVRYKTTTGGHWVLFDHSGMVYNGLDYSKCVATGMPDLNDVRDIIQL